jgi:predicted HNH restriction endonuclease
MSADSELYFYTSENYTVHAESVSKTFTKPARRQERNPELERIVHQAMSNERRRNAQQFDELQRIHDEEMQAIKEANAKPKPKSKASTGDTQEEQSQDQQGQAAVDATTGSQDDDKGAGGQGSELQNG